MVKPLILAAIPLLIHDKSEAIQNTWAILDFIMLT